MERPIIRFFTDHNVPESVGRALISAGHQVRRLKDVMPQDSEDAVIEVACSHSGEVLVTHDGDFRVLGISRRQYANKLHRIQLRCDPTQAARRVQEAMSLIEHEWIGLAHRGDDKPMVIEIRDEVIRILR